MAFKYCIDPATVTELFSTLQFPNAGAQMLFLTNPWSEDRCGQQREKNIQLNWPGKPGRALWSNKCIKIIAANTILAVTHAGKSCGQNQQHVQ